MVTMQFPIPAPQASPGWPYSRGTGYAPFAAPGPRRAVFVRYRGDAARTTAADRLFDATSALEGSLRFDNRETLRLGRPGDPQEVLAGGGRARGFRTHRVTLPPDQRFLVVAGVIQNPFFRSLLVDPLSQAPFLTLVAKVPF